jgi:hypothetical protein
MVVEVLAGCATVCFCATLRFTKWLVAQEQLEMKSMLHRAERCSRDPISTRLADVRVRKNELERLFRSISHYTTNGSFDDKQLKDKRLSALNDKLEELSKLEAAILKGEA